MPETNVIWLGPAPAEEESAQIGDPAYLERALAECRQFIEAIKHKMGDPPDGVVLRMVSAPHELGAYYEVVVEFDPDNDEATRWAYRADANAPTRWCDVGMTAPKIKQGPAR